MKSISFQVNNSFPCIWYDKIMQQNKTQVELRNLYNAIIGTPLNYESYNCNSNYNLREKREELVEVTAIAEIYDSKVYEKTLTMNFELIPNPNNGRFTLYTKMNEYKNLQAEIYNSVGQLLQAINLKTDELMYEFDCTAMPQGLYNILVKDSNDIIFNSKFIVSH